VWYCELAGIWLDVRAVLIVNTSCFLQVLVQFCVPLCARIYAHICQWMCLLLEFAGVRVSLCVFHCVYLCVQVVLSFCECMCIRFLVTRARCVRSCLCVFVRVGV